MIFTDIAGIAEAKKNGLRIFGAALGDGARDIGAVSLEGAAVAIGNEGSGLTDEFLAVCGERIIIPMLPECESLNAAIAAAIVMWQQTNL